MKKKRRILIVCPHPDDGEAFVSQLGIQGVKTRCEVHQVLATCDEYGTPIKKFKGERIRRIRKFEMLKAQKAYGLDKKGNPLLHLHWMNYIDGFVPYNKKAILRLQQFIKKIKPDIIIGPDPFIYCDGHSDHLALGKTYFFALKWLDPKNRPKLMLFFQTLMPDFFLPKLFKDAVYKTREAHLSQWSFKMVRLMEIFYILTQISYQLKYSHFKWVEGYRKVRFDQKNNIPHGIAKLIFYIFREKPLGCELGRFIPGPGFLGLDLEPKNEIL